MNIIWDFAITKIMRIQQICMQKFLQQELGIGSGSGTSPVHWVRIVWYCFSNSALKSFTFCFKEGFADFNNKIATLILFPSKH